MSCWIVEDAHISAMLTFMHSHELHGCYAWEERETRYADGSIVSERNRIGQTLLDANYASCAHRYPREAAYQEIPRYRWKRTRVLSPVEMLKAVECYEYQSCERDDWRESAACKLVQQMRGRAIATLDGYEQAPWGFDADSVKVSA